MYVVNPEKYDQSRLYTCDKQTADKLIKEKIPVFGRDNENRYYFSKTEVLKKALERLEIKNWEVI